MGKVLGARLLLALLAFFLLLLLRFLPPLERAWPLLLPLFGLVVAQALHLGWVLTAKGQVVLPLAIELGQRVATLLGLVLLVRKPGDETGYALIAALTALLASGATGWAAVRWLGLRIPRPQLAGGKVALREGWWLFLSQGGGGLLAGGNAFLLGLFAPSHAVAQYAVAEKLVLTASAILQPLFRSFYPKAAREGGEGVHEGFLRMGGKALGLALFLGTLAAIALALLGPRAIPLVFGPGYEEGAQIVRVLGLWTLLSALSLVWGYLVLLPLGHDRVQTYLLWGSGGLQVALVPLLAPRYGAWGMALAFLLAGGALALGQAAYLLRLGVSPGLDLFPPRKQGGGKR